MEHRAEEGAVLVDALEVHLHVAVEQARLDEIAGLAREGLGLLGAVVVAAEAGALDAREHERDLVEAG